jgi:hypothetical protein
MSMSVQIIHALRRCVASRAHIKVYNALSIRHPRLEKSLLIRAHPFEHMTYFDETRTDCIAFRASWAARYCGIEMGDYDLTKEHHRMAVGYGRVILLFEARIRPMPGVDGRLHTLAFVEEYWPLPHDIWKGGAGQNRDILSTEFSCLRLYGGSPAKIYTIMPIDCILGPAHIVPDPVHRTIPHARIKSLSLLHGRADTSAGSDNGSELYRLNMWTMTWGSEEPLLERCRNTSRGGTLV